VCVGSLLSGVLREVIDSVLLIVELSVDDCVCLQRVFTSLVTSSTQLFQRCRPADGPPSQSVEVTVQDCVPVWLRFRELATFFSLRLSEVIDRWADGKGPMAVQLSAAELARLVVAVFEKTSRRDAFIARLSSSSQ